MISRSIRALGLFSGGLDSMLAAVLIRNQGVEVTLLCFVTPFFGPERPRESAAHLGMPLREQDLTEKFTNLLFDAPHGWGKGHNPCVDCHILMLREAAVLMRAENFDFIFTGEVLGQRPMSQHRSALNLIAKESGVADLVLRPLSAKLLKPTLPELRGWVKREHLLDIHGRGRKRQMALAQEISLRHFPSPAGGCLLTDPAYAKRLKDLLTHSPLLRRHDLELLRWGRHFRLPGGAKAVVGRTRQENEAILTLAAPGEVILKIQNFPGPIVHLSAGASRRDLENAAALAAAYSDAPPGLEVSIAVRDVNDYTFVHLTNLQKDHFKDWLI